MSSPLVSVVIPTFNRANLVVRAIESVLSQKYTNLELHLVDDGSTDDTKTVCEPYTKDSRFFYHYQPNKGQSAARNFGISKSSGEIIAFLDSDNFWYPEKLYFQIECFNNNPDYHIIYSDGVCIDAQDRKIKNANKRYSGKILRQLLINNFITNNSAIVKRICFDEMGMFDENLRYAEDYDLWLRFATRYFFFYHPMQVYAYSLAGKRLSNEKENVVETNYLILKNFFKNHGDSISLLERRRSWGHFYSWRSSIYCNSSKKKAWKNIFCALANNPFNVQAWLVAVRLVQAS